MTIWSVAKAMLIERAIGATKIASRWKHYVTRNENFHLNKKNMAKVNVHGPTSDNKYERI